MLKRKLDTEMDDEMRAHVETQAEENVASGMTPAEARYAAARQFGGLELIQENCRERRGVAWLENLPQGLKLTVWGAVAGLAVALSATRLLRGLLFGVSPADPATFATALLLAVALLACLVPARRAAKVDPMTALRAE